ncbi:hypothetical protein RA11412_1170 [Rothia aeria]|uniref:Uncharacterized protein n=1 Tax=Rothia aeria TaxID=172042 RepID=A0A2Z5R3A8_9MICC|nr:hypothetical protein RA11412_1170 [Rothia aeria]
MQAGASAQEQNPILATASRLLNRRQWLGASLKPGPGHGVGHGLCNSNVPSACIVARALAAVR